MFPRLFVLSDLGFAPGLLVLPSGLYMFRVCAAGGCFVTSYLRVLSLSERVGEPYCLSPQLIERITVSMHQTLTGCGLVGASLTTEGQSNPASPGTFDINCVSTAAVKASRLA